MFFGRGDQSLHTLGKDIHKHIGMDHQSGIMGYVVVDHHQSQVIGKTVANGSHNLLLMLQENVHQVLKERPVVVEHIKGIRHPDSQQRTVKEGREVGNDSHARALSRAHIAFQVAKLSCQRRRRLQIRQVGPAFHGAVHVAFGAIGG